MIEKEKRENEALKNCIQEAYGLSDEQLLAELEELEATLSDDEFVGAEERIYNKIKEREAERSSDFSEETTITSETSTSNSNSAPIRKISKKKRWLVVGIAAVMVVGAGVNTIGGNNYFLKQREKEEGIVLNGGQNVINAGKLTEVYHQIEEQLKIPTLKLNYIPKEMTLDDLIMDEGKAIIVFNYNDRKVYCIQSKRDLNRSVSIGNDRNGQGLSVYNEWLNMEISIEENAIEEGIIEYSSMINLKEAYCRVFGMMEEEEMVEIIKNLSY